MVFWNRFNPGLVEGEKIVFGHGERLIGWLGEQRGEKSTDWIAEVAASIKASRPSEHQAWWDRLMDFNLRARKAGAGHRPDAQSIGLGQLWWPASRRSAVPPKELVHLVGRTATSDDDAIDRLPESSRIADSSPNSHLSATSATRIPRRLS
jgi:hypothetical protein